MKLIYDINNEEHRNYAAAQLTEADTSVNEVLPQPLWEFDAPAFSFNHVITSSIPTHPDDVGSNTQVWLPNTDDTISNEQAFATYCVKNGGQVLNNVNGLVEGTYDDCSVYGIDKPTWAEVQTEKTYLQSVVAAKNGDGDISSVDKTLSVPHNVNAHTAKKYFENRDGAVQFQTDLDNAASPVENPYITLDNY